LAGALELTFRGRNPASSCHDFFPNGDVLATAATQNRILQPVRTSISRGTEDKLTASNIMSCSRVTVGAKRLDRIACLGIKNFGHCGIPLDESPIPDFLPFAPHPGDLQEVIKRPVQIDLFQPDKYRYSG
jgi:hypothetical protein